MAGNTNSVQKIDKIKLVYASSGAIWCLVLQLNPCLLYKVLINAAKIYFYNTSLVRMPTL